MSEGKFSIKEFIKDVSVQTIAGILALLIVPSGVVIYFWSNLVNTFTNIWVLLTQPVEVEIYLLLLILLVGIFSIQIYSWGFKIFSKNFRDYNKDEFYGVNWIWEYDDNKEVKLSSLQPICPLCNYKMSFYDNSFYLGITPPELQDSKDRLETQIQCLNKNCEYSNISENDFLIIENRDVDDIKRDISNRIDKTLREKGLKL